VSPNLEKLKRLLTELFQLDQADLDFGIYRIMNQRRDDITRFLDEDLLPQVQDVLGAVNEEERQQLEQEYKQAIEEAKRYGAPDPENTDAVREAKTKWEAAQDSSALENEVFSDLYNFFRRYYSEGDFISLRRYKEGVYAIPYEGEEVKLYWANHDQYYIKSSENFRDYAFRLPSGKRVHFRLVEANVEKDDRKAPTGNERRFMLDGEEPMVMEDEELVIRFVYHPDPEKRKQDAINEKTIETVLGAEETAGLLFAKADEGLGPWIKELSTPAPTEAKPNRTLLEKHLVQYTARNTFDYFIHKDLGGFLRRELDFYIKNEVMHLDDIESETAPRVEQYLNKVRAIRRIAHKIIDFLAQIENFQKKLWLKKKFVIETNYCITLDRVPEELYPEIAANDAQRDEWVRLFAIDEIKGDLASPAYSKPLTVDFLKANPYLVVDTCFFSREFTDRVLAAMNGLNEQLNALLVHSENSQALNLLRRRYQGKVQCIYIDPPYNSTASKIMYKNDYEHSSWLALMAGRLDGIESCLCGDGVLCVTIDDYELHNLLHWLISVFGPERHLATAAIRNNPQGRSTLNGFRICHEYALFFAGGDFTGSVGRLPRTEELEARWDEVDEEGRPFLWENFRKTGTDSQRADRPKQYYPIYWNGSQFRIPATEWSAVRREWEVMEQPDAGEKALYPNDDTGTQRVWKWGQERVKNNPSHVMVKEDADGDIQVYCRNYLNTNGRLPNTWWDDPRYAAGSHGTNVLTNMFGSGRAFSFPKSVFAVEDSLRIGRTECDSTVFDFFAGSGTTGHAVINLNREDNGHRKFILVEMGEYFDTVLLPRIKKVIYSKDWKNGKPVSREGISHMFKYIRLESYEDTLNNLALKRTEAQQRLLGESDSFRESYMLSYMLDVESRGSASLLNIEAFEDPFNYKLNIATGTVGETKPTTVDLVETFNYLLGLTVRHIDHIRGFRVVQGTRRRGGRGGEENVLVIWRNLKEKSNEDLDEFFRKQDYSTRDFEFDLIYVNGDNNLENLRREDETWKVRLIEEEFQRLMFDVEDV